MPTLKRPDTCRCGSSRMLREKAPERWVCVDCKTVVVSRKPLIDRNLCRSCGVSRLDSEFKEDCNICKKCAKGYTNVYYSKNNARLLKYKKEYYKDNREKIRKHSNDYWQSSMDIFLNYVYRRCKGTAKQRLGARRRDVEFEVSFSYIRRLYELNQGRCAISGLTMAHKWSDLMALSIDRIDSKRGYIEGNVQLVCMWANLAKQKFTNDDMKKVLDMYYDLRKSQESI